MLFGLVLLLVLVFGLWTLISATFESHLASSESASRKAERTMSSVEKETPNVEHLIRPGLAIAKEFQVQQWTAAWMAFKNPTVANGFKNVLATSYSRFVENLQVSSPPKLVNDWYLGVGCRPHLCGSFQSAYTVHAQTGHIASMMLEEGVVTTFKMIADTEPILINAMFGTPVLEITDLVLDHETLIGQQVAVFGTVQSVGVFARLRDKRNHLIDVKLSLSELPRSERKRLMMECANGCDGTIIGMVQGFPREIKATVLVFRAP